MESNLKYFFKEYFVNYDELIEMIMYWGGAIINCNSLSNRKPVEKENKTIEEKIIVKNVFMIVILWFIILMKMKNITILIIWLR